jgi:hypothetical protein
MMMTSMGGKVNTTSKSPSRALKAANAKGKTALAQNNNKTSLNTQSESGNKDKPAQAKRNNQ